MTRKRQRRGVTAASDPLGFAADDYVSADSTLTLLFLLCNMICCFCRSVSAMLTAKLMLQRGDLKRNWLAGSYQTPCLHSVKES